jgi:hypothetical protein
MKKVNDLETKLFYLALALGAISLTSLILAIVLLWQQTH